MTNQRSSTGLKIIVVFLSMMLLVAVCTLLGDSTSSPSPDKQPVAREASQPTQSEPQSDEPDTPTPKVADPVDDGAGWIYQVKDGKMGDRTYTARVRSREPFEFGFPYGGKQYASLVIRADSNLGGDVMVVVESGQFMCTMGCKVRIRFDDAEAKTYRATGPSDGDTDVLFLRGHTKFIKQLKKSKIVRVEAEFYQEGTRVFEFDVEGFDTAKMSK